MRSVKIVIVTVLAVATTAAATVRQRGADAAPQHVAAASAPAALPAYRAELPPPAWGSANPADSLYRAARAELAAGDYGDAAELFERIIDEYPDSQYTPDAYYWQAFALYRVGGEDALNRAVAALTEQREKHPNAATRGDATALLARITGELARLGDGDAAVVVTRAADGLYVELNEEEIDRITAQALEAAEMVTGPALEAAAMVTGPAIEAAMVAADHAFRVIGESGMEIHTKALELTGDGVYVVGHATGEDPCPEMAEENEMRVAALNALLQMDSDRALPILTDVLERRDECSAVLRRKAVFLVSQKRGPQTEELLLAAASSDPDPEVRRQAVFWLSQVPTDRALDAIAEILAATDDPKMQERAVFALSQHDDPRAAEVLRQYAANEQAPSNIREKAVFWLAEEHESAETAAFLRELFGRTADLDLKQKILFAVSEMDREDSHTWLLDVARDEAQPTSIRKKAVFWAAESGAPISGLVGLYSTMTDRELREQLIFAFSQSDDPAAVDELIRIARTEPDTELRKRAIFWLAESGDPRAVDVLQEIISQ